MEGAIIYGGGRSGGRCLFENDFIRKLQYPDIRVLFGKGAWGRSGSKLVSSVSLLPNLGGSDVSGLESRL